MEKGRREEERERDVTSGKRDRRSPPSGERDYSEGAGMSVAAKIRVRASERATRNDDPVVRARRRERERN